MYRSKLEEEVAKMYPDCVYEPFSMDYTVPHTYTPDLLMRNTEQYMKLKVSLEQVINKSIWLYVML